MEINALNTAAGSGDHDAMIQMEMQSDTGDKYRSTILHLAVMKGNMECVHLILRDLAHNNIVFQQDSTKQTALHHAVRLGHTELVKILIDAAASVATDELASSVSVCEAFVRQADENMNTALHLASSSGNVDIAKLLIEADPSNTHMQIQNGDGETPIYLAAKLGHNDIVMMICTTCTTICLDGPHGSTALHAAIMCPDKAKRTDLVMILILGAKRSSISEDAASSSFEALFTKTNSEGDTALRLAVLENELDVVKLILMEDPAYQPGNASKMGDVKKLVHIAAKKGNMDMFKLLCERGVHNKGVAAFLAAIIQRDRESVSRLLGGDKHLATYTDEIGGWTALHYAAYYKFDSILGDIVKAQKEVGYEPVYGGGTSTPLIVAVQQGHTSTLIKLMQLLPSLCVDVNDQGENILHLAAAQGNKEMITCIIKYCPKKYVDEILKQQDVNGDTPLHVLIREGCFVPELINHKRVDIITRNNNNWTPADMLYVEDTIKGDQAKIKKALDDIEDSGTWKCWQELNLYSLVLETKQSEKNAQLEEKIALQMNQDREKMKDEIRRYRERTNTQIIVTALIATVTFTVGFTMPGGYHQSGESDEGLVLLSKKKAFNAFMVSDALTLVLSTSCLFLNFIASLYEDAIQVKNLNSASTILNTFSIMGMMLTFITGTFVVLSRSLALAITICVICCFIFPLVFVMSIKFKYDRTQARLKYETALRDSHC